jgi:hypothetical protein
MDSISLTRAHRQISDYMAQHEAGLPVNLAYVDPARGTVVVGIPDIAPSVLTRYRGVLHDLAGDASLTFTRCGPAVRHAKKTEANNKLIGGLYITNPLGTGAAAAGTICIAATRQGQAGFVTAGHVAYHPNTIFYQPRKSDMNNWKAGTTLTVSAFQQKADSDSAFLQTDTSGRVETCAIWKDASSAYTVTGVAASPALGTAIFMQGAAIVKERTGKVAAVDVTVTFEGGGMLEHQLLATYYSRPGDSGAPVYIKGSNPNVQLVGLNVGAASPEDADPKPDEQMYPPERQGWYAIISPWNNIASDLQVTL